MLEKKRYKMYKDGKHWVVAAVTVAAMGLGTIAGQTTIAHADTVSSDETNAQTGSVSAATTGTTTTLKAAVTSDTTTSQASAQESDNSSEDSGGSDALKSDDSAVGSNKTAGQGTTTDSGTQVTDPTSTGTNTPAADTSSTDTSDTNTSSKDTPKPDGPADNHVVNATDKLTTDTLVSEPDTSTSETGSQESGTGNDSKVVESTDDPQTVNAQVLTNADEKVADLETDNTGDSSVTGSGLQMASLFKLANRSMLVKEAATTNLVEAQAATAESTFDDGDFSYSLNADDTVTLSGVKNVLTSATLTVPTTAYDTGTQKTYDVTAIADGAFASSTGRTNNISTVVIGDGIKSIGNLAFAYLNNLKVVDLSENHTLETIGDEAFVSTGVTSLTLPATVTAIGNGAFQYVNLTDLDMSAATQLTSIGDKAFLGSKISSLDLPDSVTSIGDNAFQFNSNLTSIKLSSNLVSIGDSAFANDDNLADVDFSQAPNLSTIGANAFDGAKLTSVNLTGATKIADHAFQDNKELTSVTLGQGIQEIGESAFSGDSNLTTLSIPSDSDLTKIDKNAFYGTGLTAVNLPAKLTQIGEGAFESNTSLQDVTFAGTAANDDLTIGTNAFAYDGKITTLNLPDNLVMIGDSAFAADNLKDADGNTIGGLTKVAFGSASRLTTVADNAFIYDTVLNEITLPDTVTTIGKQAFLANSALTSFTLPASLQSIGDNAFTYDAGLKTVDTSKAPQLTTIGNGAFEYSGLKSSGQTDETQAPTFVLPDSVKTIGNFAFAGSHLQNVTFNNGLETVGEGAFTYNELSGSLVLPDTVTAVGTKAFYGNQLNGVTVPDAATVGIDAFDYNRITQLTTSADNGSVAVNQYAAYFGDSANVTINTLFDTKVGDLTNKDLVIDPTSLTNGVTYNRADGTFNIPTGTTGFKFNWSLPDPANAGKNLYGGAYQVVLNDPDIKVVDGQAWYKDNWTPELNFISAEKPDGTSLAYKDLTVSIKNSADETVAADQVTQIPGVYKVTYTYNGDTVNAQTITLTVTKRQGTYTLTGKQSVQYSGDTPTIDVKDYQIAMSDGFVYTLKEGDLILVSNEVSSSPTKLAATGNAQTTELPNVGTYKVTLAQSAIDRVKGEEKSAAELFDWADENSDANLTITPANVTVTMTDQAQTKVAGKADLKPTFVVTADDDTTSTPIADFPLAINYSRVAGETVGEYAYTLAVSATDPLSQNFAVTFKPASLTITPAVVTVTGKDYTMKVGDATPTATDFGAKATDENAQLVSADKVTADLSQADLTTPGDYVVTLSYGDETTTVKLHVVAATTGGNNGGTTTNPGTGDEGTPTDPAKPIAPTTPDKPTIPAINPNGSQGTRKNPAATAPVEKPVKQLLTKVGGDAAVVQLADKVDKGHSQSKRATGTTVALNGGAASKSVLSAKSQNKKAQMTATEATLPQTNEVQTPWLAWLGTLLGGLGLAGWQRKRHE